MRLREGEQLTQGHTACAWGLRTKTQVLFASVSLLLAPPQRTSHTSETPRLGRAEQA